jgi:hypothetical protein
MGEESSPTQIEAIKKRVADFLHKSSSDIDQSRSAQQRLHVWFRDETGAIIPYKPYRDVKIDQIDNISQFDIGREE